MAARPRRLAAFPYVGLHRYFLTCCTLNRARVFTDSNIVSPLRDQVLRIASEEHFAVIAYCFMPDHLHLLVEALEDDADLRRFMKMLKQWTTVSYRQMRRGRLWQEGYYEHVLRDDEATLEVARYVLANPVRAKLVAEPREYPFSGSGVYSMEEILECFVLPDRQGPAYAARVRPAPASRRSPDRKGPAYTASRRSPDR